MTLALLQIAALVVWDQIGGMVAFVICCAVLVFMLFIIAAGVGLLTHAIDPAPSA